MAKDNSKDSNKTNDKKGKSGLIVLIVFIVVVAVAITLTALNAFGLRDNVLVPMLRNVPIIGGFMPDAPIGEDTIDYGSIILELEGQIETLREENASLLEDVDSLYEIARILEQENEWLREFETLHDERTAAFEELQRAVVEEEQDAFMEFFATMHPALQEEIFRELAGLQARAEEWENYVGAWGAMSPAAVAQAIEVMATTHMNLVTDVLPDLPLQTRAAILNALETDTRAAVLRQMNP